jgi:hypothetical protein
MTARPAFHPRQQRPFIFCNGGDAVGLLQGERETVSLRDAPVYGPDPSAAGLLQAWLQETHTGVRI